MSASHAAECEIATADFADWLGSQPDSSADLVLTDPPYTISRPTGFDGSGGDPRFRVVSYDFGDWDYTPIDLPLLAEQSFQVLREGGQVIIFYDLWKITLLADALTNAGFKQLRLVVWQKTNPVPINAARNYLANSREIAVAATKGRNPTFHSANDNGIYAYPIPHRGAHAPPHPTQKPLPLFAQLIRKHTNRGDLVIDPFLGSGTTALAALQTGRRFAGCDIAAEWAAVSRERVAKFSGQTEIDLKA